MVIHDLQKKNFDNLCQLFKKSEKIEDFYERKEYKERVMNLINIVLDERSDENLQFC